MKAALILLFIMPFIYSSESDKKLAENNALATINLDELTNRKCDISGDENECKNWANSINRGCKSKYKGFDVWSCKWNSSENDYTCGCIKWMDQNNALATTNLDELTNRKCDISGDENECKDWANSINRGCKSKYQGFDVWSCKWNSSENDYTCGCIKWMDENNALATTNLDELTNRKCDISGDENECKNWANSINRGCKSKYQGFDVWSCKWNSSQNDYTCGCIKWMNEYNPLATTNLDELTNRKCDISGDENECKNWANSINRGCKSKYQGFDVWSCKWNSSENDYTCGCIKWMDENTDLATEEIEEQGYSGSDLLKVLGAGTILGAVGYFLLKKNDDYAKEESIELFRI